jgi:polyisoprenoid-binding protein YceI
MTTTTTALPLTAGRWTLDPFHSSVGFTIRHLGVSKVRGRFARFDLALEVGDTLESSSLAATVDVASIDTGNADRDAHVLAPDILDVSQRPTLDFLATRITGGGDSWVAEGELTIGAVTRPVTLDVAFGGVEVFPVDGSRHAGFEATTQLRLKDYGIDVFGLGDVVKVELDVQLVEPSAS